MRVSVELHTRDYATVHYAPSLLDRLLLRRSRERAAVYDGLLWRWVGGHMVDDPVVLRSLIDALRDRIVARLVRATAPPG